MPSSSFSSHTQDGRPCAATGCAGADRTSSARPRCPSPWAAAGCSGRRAPCPSRRSRRSSPASPAPPRSPTPPAFTACRSTPRTAICSTSSYRRWSIGAPTAGAARWRTGCDCCRDGARVRTTASARFLIAVKLNSADFQRGGFDADDSLTVACALEKEGIDLLEISGGTYESTAMVTGMPQRESTRAREAYFLEFAERFSKEVSVPIMLTGGFRTRQGMKDALDSGAVDIVGLARPITYEPDLPQRLLDGTAEKSLVTPKTLGHKNIDDLLNSAWHQQQIARMGRGRAVRPRRSPAIALAIALLTTGRDLLVPWLAPS